MTALPASPLRWAPSAIALLGLMPVAAGLAAVIAAAFGWCPPLGAHELTVRAFHDLAAVPGIWRSALLSGVTGFASAALSFLAAALLLAAYHRSAKFSALRHVLSPLLSLPHAALALGFAFLIAPSGILFRLAAPAAGWDLPPDVLTVHDRWGVSLITGLVLKEVSFLFLMMLAALPQTGAARYLPVAASLGYAPGIGFLKVVMPLVYPQLRLPIIAVIAYAASAADVALILGPTTPAPLPVVVLMLAYDPDLSRQAVASAAAVLQIAVTAAAVLTWIACERAVAGFARGWIIAGARQRGERTMAAAAAAVSAVGAVTLAMIALAIALWSIAAAWRFPALLPEGYSVQAWQNAGVMALAPLEASALIGLIAAAAGLVLALLSHEGTAAGGRMPPALATLALYAPLAVPQVALMRGMTVLFLMLGLGEGWAAVLVSHLIFVLPYVMLSLAGPWAAFDRRYIAVARALGASPARAFWRVRLPMMRAAVATAASVGFAVSAGQYLPSLMAGGGRVATITTEAVALAAGSDRRIAAVYAVLQMLLPALGFAAALAMMGRRGRRQA